jgi:hypothetical protein
MQQFYRVVYRVEKGDDTAALVDRAANAVAASGSPDHPISFLFTDPLLRTQRSALEYLVKSYPVFEPYYKSAPQFPMRDSKVITDTLPETSKAEIPPVPAAITIEVARGIPRRFPFGFATFMWRDVPALDLAPHLPAADHTVGGMHGRLAGRVGVPVIVVSSSWGAGKRNLSLIAVARIGEGDARELKPTPPDATRELLERLGRKKTDDVYALPDAGQAATRAKDESQAMSEAFARAKSALIARIGDLALEPLQNVALGKESFQNPGSVRDPLAKALSPLGYSPLPEAGATGMLVFVKSTTQGDELRVIVDRGTWSHHFIARLEIRTPQWIRSMSIPLAPDDVPPRQYPLIDQEQIRRLCANVATVVSEIEATVYPGVCAAKND